MIVAAVAVFAVAALASIAAIAAHQLVSVRLCPAVHSSLAVVLLKLMMHSEFAAAPESPAE